MTDDLDNFSCCWQESTAQRVLDTAQAVVTVQSAVSSLVLRANALSDSYRDMAERFREWRSIYPEARNALRARAIRHTSIRVSFQKDYFAVASQLNKALQDFALATTSVTFKLMPPAKVFTEADVALPCDPPLIDQIGLSIPFQLGFLGSEYVGNIALTIGMVCSGTAPAFYLARKPRLQDVSPDLPETITNSLVAQIQEHVREKLGSQTIDLGPIGTLQNTGYSLSPLAARTGIAAVGIECAAVPNAAGVSPLYSAAFPKPEVTIADWADSAIEIVPNVFFQAMKGMIEQHLPAPLVFSERLSNVGPAPAQYPSPGSFLHLSGDVWCIDDFGDRKDYGLHDLYSGIEWRTTSNPGEIQVYLKSFVLGQVVFGLTLLPDVPLATLQNVDRVETTLGVDLAAISIRYRRN